MTDSKINSFIAWMGCAVVCVGAIATSFHIDPLNVYAFNLGSLLYGYWGYRTKQWNQVIVNAFLIVVYTIGVFYRLANS
jgi:hypothetical protein